MRPAEVLCRWSKWCISSLVPQNMKSLSNRATFSYGAQILDFGMPAPNADARLVLPIFPTPGCQLAFRGAIRPAAPEGSEVID